MDPAPAIEFAVPFLEAFSTHAGIAFPADFTPEMFLRELAEGGPGASRDQALFARLVVGLVHSGLNEDQERLAELKQLIQERLSTRGAKSA